MTATFTIGDSDTSVNLMNTSTTGIIPLRDGMQPIRLNPHVYDVAMSSEEDLLVVERWKLKVAGSDHDDASDKLESLIAVLRNAWRYHNDPSYNKPVYITRKTANETGTRYALVYQSPEISALSFLDVPFSTSNFIQDLGLSIARGVWRDNIPGNIGTAKTLSKTSGSADGTLVHVANFLETLTIGAFKEDDGGSYTDLSAGDTLFPATVAQNDAIMFMGDVHTFPKHVIIPKLATAGDLTTTTLALEYSAQDELIDEEADFGSVTENGSSAIADDGDEIKVTIDGSQNTTFGTVTTPSDDTEMFLRFTLRPASITMSSGDIFTIMSIVDGTAVNGETVFAYLEMRYDGANHELRAGVRHDDGSTTSTTSLYDVSTGDEVDVLLEIVASSGVGADDGYLKLNVDGELKETLSGIDNDQKNIDSWYAGAIAGIDAGTSGSFFFKNFRAVYGAPTWTALTQGTDYTCFPGSDLEACLEQDDYDIAINVKPPTDAMPARIDGDSGIWIRLQEENAAPSYATNPIQSSDTAYLQTKPYIELSADLLAGDIVPYLSMELLAPAGGSSDCSFASLSRVIMGAKQNNVDNFEAYLNLGGKDNDSDWAITYGANTVEDYNTPGPGGPIAVCDFDTDDTLVMRVRLTGTDKLGYYEGEYRPFIRCEQVGGSDGDVEIMLRAQIHGTGANYPIYETEEIELSTTSDGPEIVEMIPGGVLRLPLVETENLDTVSGGDLYFEIHAESAAGSAATLRLYDLILIPVDKWGCELDDPISSTMQGNSALRDFGKLTLDGGVMKNRTFKSIGESGSTSFYPAETWSRHGDRPRIEPGKKTRIYFLMMHYPTTWGTGPLIGSLGMHLAVQMYGHNCFMFMRGDR